MTIVITGAAGMIGSGIIRHLNDQGIFNLLLVDDLENSDKWKNLVGKQFIDIISKNQLLNWLKEISICFYCVCHLPHGRVLRHSRNRC